MPLARTGGDGVARDEIPDPWRQVALRDDLETVVLPDADAGERGIAGLHRLLGDQIEDRREISRRIVDDLQHLGRRGLLVEGLAQFGLAPLPVGDVEIGQQPPAIGQNHALIQQGAPVGPLEFHRGDVAGADRRHARFDEGVEFRFGHFVDLVVAVVVDQLGHRRTRRNERLRNAPHLPEGPVDDSPAQVAVHEQHAVIDRIEHGVQFAQQLFLLPI